MPAESSAAPEDDVAAPATTFAALGVPAPLVEVLDDQGITTPFPVQAATLPDGLAGRDILGRAQTGSGKTLGFSLPLVTRLAGGSTLSARPRGLVLVPTRELATQVTAVLKPLARAMGLGVTTIYGGVGYDPQINGLQRRTDIVVATPGRLADLIGQGECDLSDVEVTVIDEADQMADLGFLPIVRRLLETTPDRGQRMLFSATLDAAVDVLARRFLHDPVLHSVDENSTPAEIEHHLLTVDAASRVAVIAALAGGENRSLVFTRTKHGAERLARQLTDAGIPAAELHGNLRQGARSKNLAAFSSGLARVMVATDIAARGIHIDGIDLVIHADPPTEHKAYVHRSGRTARGGADGIVVTLQTRAQVRDVTAMMRKSGITPHAAVAVDADSAEITEIAGPPASRVAVSGKVAELVRPEDRLSKNDRPGAGASGRPRRGQEHGRPRDDRFRDRRPRDFAPRGRGGFGDERAPAAGRPAAGEPYASPGRPAQARTFERDQRPARFDRDERPSRFERDERPARFERDDRPSRGERFDREERAPRFARPESRDRDGRPAHADRDRSRPSDRDERPARFDRGGSFAEGNRSDRGDRRPDDRRPDDRGFGSRSHGAPQGRRDNRGDRDNSGDRGGNDWWPRAARPAQPGYRRPGSPWRPAGAGGQADGGNRAARDDRNRTGWNRDDRGRDSGGSRPFRDDRSFRAERPFRDDRPARDDRPRDDRPARDERSGRDDRPFRAARPQAGGRPPAGGQQFRPGAGRNDRPQAGGHFGGSSSRAGYSAGPGAAGKRRGTGQGRHF
jgi:superfamily II DNA/RNA helicase